MWERTIGETNPKPYEEQTGERKEIANLCKSVLSLSRVEGKRIGSSALAGRVREQLAAELRSGRSFYIRALSIHH